MDSSRTVLRVLILDDDPATLTLEHKILVRAGFTVVDAPTPEAARDALRDRQADLLVLDYRLDGPLNGLDFFRAMREEGLDVPAILVTSFSDESKAIEALRAGIRDVVPKAGDYLEYLPQAVERVVHQVRAERELAESDALRQLVDRLRLETQTNARLVEALRSNAEERERLLESERAARAESDRASHLKDEFLATLSHELRTPLNAILGWAQLLRARPSDAQQIADGLETIERNARVQTQIVDDLLEMSRIISGKLRLDVQQVDLAAVIESSLRTVRPAADAKSIRLQPVLDPRAGPISGDPARIQQILWNLLSNAIKFTPKDGRVQVVLARVNSHVELVVSDTGMGIRPEFLPYLFDRFRQGDASTTRQHRGIGLGLSIVKNLVEMHGGTVTASSAGADKGSTFVVKLPLTIVLSESPREEGRLHPAAAEAFGTRANDTPRLTGLRLLVVDDEPDARDLLKRILGDYEADVEVASSAREALASIAKQSPDVLISDIGMPEVDGYELVRTVRRLPADRGGLTPALALTAFARSEDRQRALLAGYQAHLAKPVQASELVTLVASLAGRLWSKAAEADAGAADRHQR
jgi:signal transduction histidine kinase